MKENEIAAGETASETAVGTPIGENAVDRILGEGVGGQKLPECAERAENAEGAESEEMGICNHCGCEVPKSSLVEARDKYGNHILICGECRKIGPFVECECCGELVHADFTERDCNSNDVCRYCVNEHYVECHDCGEWVRREDANEIGGELFCDNCEDDWCVCYDCGRLIRRNNSYYTHYDTRICERCYDNHYGACGDCDEVFAYDDLEWNERDDCYYCRDCHDRHQHAEGVMGYHSFSRCKYRPRSADGEVVRGDTLLLGVELECDGGSFDESDFEDWTDDGNLIHFESDGSLSDDGVELITMPCTLKFHREKLGWKRILDTLIGEDFKSHQTDCCGLHVHLSRAALRPTTIVKMDVFVNRAHEFFSQIARRDVFYSSHYVPNKRADARKAIVDYTGHEERYTAVNTTNERTVEIRIFRGTLKYQTLMGTIEMCAALPGFLDNIPLPRIYDMEENIVKFIDYIGERREEFPHAIPMMSALVRNGDYTGEIRHWQARCDHDRDDNVAKMAKERGEERKCA